MKKLFISSLLLSTIFVGSIAAMDTEEIQIEEKIPSKKTLDQLTMKDVHEHFFKKENKDIDTLTEASNKNQNLLQQFCLKFSNYAEVQDKRGLELYPEITMITDSFDKLSNTRVQKIEYKNSKPEEKTHQSENISWWVNDRGFVVDNNKKNFYEFPIFEYIIKLTRKWRRKKIFPAITLWSANIEQDNKLNKIKTTCDPKLSLEQLMLYLAIEQEYKGKGDNIFPVLIGNHPRACKSVGSLDLKERTRLVELRLIKLPLLMKTSDWAKKNPGKATMVSISGISAATLGILLLKKCFK